MQKSNKNISIVKVVNELLYEHERVIIPQLGAFTKKYKSATCDYVQGRVMPPASELIFNEHIIIDDGVLMDSYQKKYELTQQETQQDIWDFAKEAKERLKKKEVLSLKNIGRLMMDYENNVKFISDHQNFNTNTFGLPFIEFYPIVRQEESEASMPTSSPQHSETKPSSSVKTSKKRLLRVALPLLLVVGIIAAIVLIGQSQKENSLAIQEQPNVEQPSDLENEVSINGVKRKVNLVPGEEIEKAVPVPTEEVENQETKAIQPKKEEIVTSPKKDRKKVVARFSNTIILVGFFSKQVGVDITVKKIEKKGWKPYTQQLSKGTRVGVYVPVETSIQHFLKQVQQDIDKGAFVRK